MRQVFLLLLSFNYFISFSQYKPKFLVEYNTPRRLDLGIKLLCQKPFSFSLKCGYQAPFIHTGLYRGKGSNFSKILGLNGLVLNSTAEIILKNPHHAFSSEFEYSLLQGNYKYPNYFNVGRDYGISYSKVNGNSYTFLFGYYYHFYRNLNTSLFLKIGGIYREIKESIYFESYSRMSGAPNLIKTPIDKKYFETEFAVRIGLQYCFGYKRLFK